MSYEEFPLMQALTNQSGDEAAHYSVLVITFCKFLIWYKPSYLRWV